MKVNESSLDKKSIWYFGNNHAKNLKLSPPKWYAPFFLTTDYEYAKEYSDYGVYTIQLKDEIKSKILDFNKESDVKKLSWPKELIDEIKTGKSDLNAIAYDLYILASHADCQLWRLARRPLWEQIAKDFDRKSSSIMEILPVHSSWGNEKDHRFILQMWKDIYDAGFDGFTHIEFGNKVLAIFNFHCIDKISIQPVN